MKKNQVSGNYASTTQVGKNEELNEVFTEERIGAVKKLEIEFDSLNDLIKETINRNADKVKNWGINVRIHPIGNLVSVELEPFVYPLNIQE